jgi:hypothetical protein
MVTSINEGDAMTEDAADAGAEELDSATNAI